MLLNQYSCTSKQDIIKLILVYRKGYELNILTRLKLHVSNRRTNNNTRGHHTRNDKYGFVSV